VAPLLAADLWNNKQFMKLLFGFQFNGDKKMKHWIWHTQFSTELNHKRTYITCMDCSF
jgi:hypothetical protein